MPVTLPSFSPTLPNKPFIYASVMTRPQHRAGNVSQPQQVPTHYPGKLVATQLRGDKYPENLWTASAVVVDKQGNVLHRFAPGDGQQVIKARSTIKPLHAAMLYKVIKQANEQGQDTPVISPEEWVILSASHAGSRLQTSLVESVLSKFQLTPDAIISGTHPPLSQARNEELIRAGEKPDTLMHQCSGHHAGLAILSTYLGADPKDYWEPDGKLQQFSQQQLQAWTGKATTVNQSYDNCNIPTVSAPMSDYAALYAKLVSDAELQPLVEAIENHPDLISDEDAVDAQVMKASRGKLLAKLGADGFLCVANRETGQAMGLKVWSGNGASAGMLRDKVVLPALQELGWLSPKEAKSLQEKPAYTLFPKIHPKTNEPLYKLQVNQPLWDNAQATLAYA